MTLLKILLAGAALVSGNAFAQAYVIGGVGGSHLNADCNGTTSCGNSSTAAKITGGYSFGKGFSAELGYVSFGAPKSSIGSIEQELTTDAWTLAAAYTLPFSQQWSGIARLGIASVNSKSSVRLGSASGSQSETNTAAYVGLGVDYAFTKNVKLEGAIDLSASKFGNQTGGVQAYTVGLRYDF